MNDVIKDILNMFETNSCNASDEEYKELGERFASMFKERMNERPREKKLRLSQLGQCKRKIWYSQHDVQGEKLRPQTRMKFLFGDMIEEFYIFLIKQSGHSVENEQLEVELAGIKGHIDCTIDGKLVDIKSCSTYGYKKFADNSVHLDDPFGYQAQLSAYAQATGFIPAGWMAMDKTLGNICASQYSERHAIDMEKEAEIIKEQVACPVPPSRCAQPIPEGKSGNLKLPTVCSYCEFKRECYKDMNMGAGLRVFMYSNKPVFLAHVAKEPRVNEVYFDKDGELPNA